MRDSEKPQRMGPFRLATELLGFVERQLDAVRKELGPKVAGYARLVVVALALGAMAGLALSLVRLAERGSDSARELSGDASPVGVLRGSCSSVESGESC